MNLKINDYVYYRNIRGVITDIIPSIAEYGDNRGQTFYYIKVLQENGKYFIDYFYCFTFDIQRTRDNKLKEIGI
jgi:hypothetical protein